MDVTVFAATVLDEIERAVVGRRPALEHILVALLADGHVLLEDLPGLGKTQMARSFATVLGLGFTRVQFTPDLVPADLTGSSIFDPRRAEFIFHPGPVFTNVLLGDEINRTPPKTQSALLEAMEEHQVTVDGETLPLPSPFLVLATDNPIEYEGTYPLPEAQLDRFAIRLSLGYLTAQDEATMLRRRIDRAAPQVGLRAVTDAVSVTAAQAEVETVHVADDIIDYCLRLVARTRAHPQLTVGASPRAALTLLQLARARALLSGRDFVVAEDIKIEAVPGLGHRLGVRPELWVRRITGENIMRSIVDDEPAPSTRPEQQRTVVP